jgi:hypothetical protein
LFEFNNSCHKHLQVQKDLAGIWETVQIGRCFVVSRSNMVTQDMFSIMCVKQIIM